MKKRILILLLTLVVLLPLLVACKDTPKKAETEEELALAGKSFVSLELMMKEKTTFFITLNEDMTFNYLESANSTHLGKGTWSVTESTVTLYEEEGDRTFVFKVSQNSLLYDKANSSEFPSTKLEDGASFSYIENLE